MKYEVTYERTMEIEADSEEDLADHIRRSNNDSWHYIFFQRVA